MTNSNAEENYDVLIAGGGPGGASAAIVLARAGLRVALFEKERHPRFHIGESLLPRNAGVIHELGLAEAISKMPKLDKVGAEFGWGDDPKTMRFGFTDGLLPGTPKTWNVERALFDKLLIDEARMSEANIFENTAVKKIESLEDDSAEHGVQLLVADARGIERRVRGKFLIDASGQSTLVGRQLGTRKNFDDPELQKVAYFEHFENVERCEGEPGHPTLIMCDEGWFWLIGLNETTTSIGFVTRPRFAREINVPADRLLQWAIARCPVVRNRMRAARGPSTNRVLADFSYRCDPLATGTYFLVGDAGAFLDPIFSTGVTLAMIGGQKAAQLIIARLNGSISPRKAIREYTRFVNGGSAPLWKLIRAYYTPSFRELFMSGSGPLKVHRAVLSILAGQVFPKPIWALRWRMRFFYLCLWAQKHFALTPHRAPFKLLNEAPRPLDESVLKKRVHVTISNKLSDHSAIAEMAVS